MLLRSTIAIALAFAATSALAAAFGCGGIGVLSEGGGNDGVYSNQPTAAFDASSLGTTYDAIAQISDGSIPEFRGNPLCLVPLSGKYCNPQLDNMARDAETANEKCRSLEGDQGDGGGDGGSYACHVGKKNGLPQPVCMAEGDSQDTCKAPIDCRAGLECVGGQTGACRHYCCDADACDANTFCDVQKVFGGDAIVPVCMPIAPCELFAAGCPGQTCGIVEQDKGLTSCIDIGPRQAGEECEDAHCAAGLVCLGSVGSRKCLALCETKATGDHSCPMGQQCKTNGVTFHDANVGVCQ
jgi:hypothetical protein